MFRLKNFQMKTSKSAPFLVISEEIQYDEQINSLTSTSNQESLQSETNTPSSNSSVPASFPTSQKTLVNINSPNISPNNSTYIPSNINTLKVNNLNGYPVTQNGIQSSLKIGTPNHNNSNSPRVSFTTSPNQSIQSSQSTVHSPLNLPQKRFSKTPPKNLKYNIYSPQFDGTDPSRLLHTYGRILISLRDMKNRVDILENHILGIANESSHLKYSRRLLQVSNIVLALYIGLRTLRLFWLENAKNIIFSFWSEYAFSARSPKEGAVKTFLRKRAKAALQNSDNQMKMTWKSMQLLIISWFGGSLIRIVLLVFSTYWLQKIEIWKRRVGVWISFISNVHVALTTDVSPWTIYFNIFTLIVYITTRSYQHIIPQQLDKYVDRGIRSVATPAKNFIKSQRQKNDPKLHNRGDFNDFKKKLEDLEWKILHEERWNESNGEKNEEEKNLENTISGIKEETINKDNTNKTD